jgi:diaminohydroxyphosphoribosylaminopyrimidine deaminase / 5-amino-6-(5-phosphoribosylamino)uracil reductase
VGAVIVYNGEVISEGFHRAFGQAHAEVNAINAVGDKEILEKSTLYVNLEPCAHKGKTPPCCDLIIEKGIKKVIVGTIDPNSVVAGKGIDKLKRNGVDVTVGVLEAECRKLNNRFFTFHEKKQPYIILKWAQTQDGYIDKIRKSNEDIGANWISNPLSRTLVHKWRSEEQAIMVGTNTVIYDNPKLNVRYWKGSSPLRVIIDRHLRIPNNLNIYSDNAPSLIFNSKISVIQKNIEFQQIDFESHELRNIFSNLFERNINSVLIEGGKKLLESLIEENWWDEARVFIGEKKFGKGLPAPHLDHIYFADFLLNDQIRYYYNH